MAHKEITQAVWDCANQQIYDLKRELARLTLLEKDYITEIESLQLKHSKEQKELQARVNTLEDEKRVVEQSKTKSIEEVEEVLFAKCEEIRVLKEQLESASSSKPASDDPDELQALKCKVRELEEENINLKEENCKLQSCVEDLEKDLHNYEEIVNNLKDECSSLTGNYKCKVEDLNEAKEMIEMLQDELMSTKTELEVIKSKSTESNGQGNSLFAEVDERRLQLQTKVNRMKSHYEQMKLQITRLEDQVFKMRIENGTLRQNWEKEIEERANDKYDTEEGYKKRIHSLESLIKDYKKELEMRPLVSTKTMKQEELAFIEYRIGIKNNEIQNLLDKINENSLSNMILVERNREATKEASSWQLKYFTAKEDLEKRDEVITELEGTLREMEIANLKTDAIVLPSSESHYRESYIDFSRLKKRSCSLLLENKEIVTELTQPHKENQAGIGNIKKRVQFTEETKENVPRDKNYRRGGKTIVYQPMILKKKEF